MSGQHAYRDYGSGNMVGKCSALTEHSLRGDKMLGCHRPEADPVHVVARSHQSLGTQCQWCDCPRQGTYSEEDLQAPDPGPAGDCADCHHPTSPWPDADLEQWWVTLRASQQSEVHTPCGEGDTWCRDCQLAAIAAGVEYASEEPLPRPGADTFADMVSEEILELGATPHKIARKLHGMADWYSDSHPEDDKTRMQLLLAQGVQIMDRLAANGNIDRHSLAEQWGRDAAALLANPSLEDE